MLPLEKRFPGRQLIRPVVELAFCSPFWHWAASISPSSLCASFLPLRKGSSVLPSSSEFIRSFGMSHETRGGKRCFGGAASPLTASCCCRGRFCCLSSCKRQTPFSKTILMETEGKPFLPGIFLLVWWRGSRSGRLQQQREEEGGTVRLERAATVPSSGCWDSRLARRRNRGNEHCLVLHLVSRSALAAVGVRALSCSLLSYRLQRRRFLFGTLWMSSDHAFSIQTSPALRQHLCFMCLSKWLTLFSGL